MQRKKNLKFPYHTADQQCSWYMLSNWMELIPEKKFPISAEYMM